MERKGHAAGAMCAGHDSGGKAKALMLHTRGQNCILIVLAAHRTVCQLHAQGRSTLLLFPLIRSIVAGLHKAWKPWREGCKW